MCRQKSQPPTPCTAASALQCSRDPHAGSTPPREQADPTAVSSPPSTPCSHPQTDRHDQGKVEDERLPLPSRPAQPQARGTQIAVATTLRCTPATSSLQQRCPVPPPSRHPRPTAAQHRGTTPHQKDDPAGTRSMHRCPKRTGTLRSSTPPWPIPRASTQPRAMPPASSAYPSETHTLESVHGGAWKDGAIAACGKVKAIARRDSLRQGR